jgi:hypothetical protein
LVVAPVVHADPQKVPATTAKVVSKTSTPHAPTTLEQKAVAEANQIRIDTKLKKLLVLKNMKGELAHE